MTTLYGIPNCDTVKKARKWLEANDIAYKFHDFRKDGLEKSQVNTWIKALGFEAIINKRSTTWRGLSDEQKNNLDASTALALALEQPTIIKRPVLAHNDALAVGFKADNYQAVFK